MEEIYKNILLLVHSLTQLSGTSYMFKNDPSEANGEKIVDIVDKCENKFLKVKEEIVKMIKNIEDATKDKKTNESQDVEVDTVEIKAIRTNNGFLIRND